MTKKMDLQIDGSDLRRLAEERLGEMKRTASPLGSAKDSLRLLHELQVHEIEMEMQNLELLLARDELDTALEKYTDLYDFAPTSYVTLDRKGEIRGVNQTGAGLLGIARSQLIGRCFAHFVPLGARSTLADFLEKVFTSLVKETCEVSLLIEGSSPHFVQIEAVVASSGEECRIVLIDISERKKIEELQQSEARYRSVVEDQSEIICRFRVGGELTFVNDVYCRFFGKIRDELLGSKWYSNAFPDDIPIINEQLRALSPTNPVFVMENRVYSGSGEIRWMQLDHRGGFDTEGRLIEIQVVGRDITERKILEHKLRQSLKSTRTANNAMRRLMLIIAHEFRTPLGLLTGSADILDRYWDRLTPEKRFEQNEQIRSAARQISNLINSVISFNQLGTDISGNPPQLLEIEDICRSIAGEVETVWSGGQEFDVTIAADCGTAVLDVNLFRRILENLLINAFHYTPADGTMSLQICREENRLLVEIIDTGIGIPEVDQAFIFDAFYRSRNVEGRRGLGLGLSIVHESLSQMGGSITMTSRTGEGTTMRVEIPVVPT